MVRLRTIFLVGLGAGGAAGIGRRYSGLTLLKERGIAYVVAVEKGSPGGVAKIRPGDVVAKINGRSTRLMPNWELRAFGHTLSPNVIVPFQIERGAMVSWLPTQSRKNAISSTGRHPSKCTAFSKSCSSATPA